MRQLHLSMAVLAGCVLALLVAAAPQPARGAVASNYFASVNGSGTACTQGNPCSLATAVARAVNGDTVYVARGTYTGTGSVLLAPAKSIILAGGWDGAASGTSVVRWPAVLPSELNGEGHRRVLYVNGPYSITLDGFLLTGGAGGEGPGLSVYNNANVTVRHSIIAGNATQSNWGGGVYVEAAGVTIEHSAIVSNVVVGSAGGGLAAAFGAQVTLRNVLIAGNSAADGAGLRLRDVSASLVNVTVARNVGDGIHAGNTALALTNNIVVSNTYGLRADAAVTPTIAYNDVWGNSTANYSGLADPTGTAGNISADPRLVSSPFAHFVGHVFSGYYLSQVAAGQTINSPALNAGSAPAASVLGAENDYLSTRTDSVADAGTVDLGYHHPHLSLVMVPLALWQQP